MQTLYEFLHKCTHLELSRQMDSVEKKVQHMGAAQFNHHLISRSISNRPPNDDANILTSKCRKPLLPQDALPWKTVTLGSLLRFLLTPYFI